MSTKITLSEAFADRLAVKNVFVRTYSGGHERLFHAVGLLHTELCRYDETNLRGVFKTYPALQTLLNDWAQDQYATRDFPPDTPYFWCAECHGTDVQTAAYVNLNTHEVHDDYGTWNWMEGRYNYCSDCSDQVEILTETPTTTPNRGAV